MRRPFLHFASVDRCRRRRRVFTVCAIMFHESCCCGCRRVAAAAAVEVVGVAEPKGSSPSSLGWRRDARARGFGCGMSNVRKKRSWHMLGVARPGVSNATTNQNSLPHCRSKGTLEFALGHLWEFPIETHTLPRQSITKPHCCAVVVAASSQQTVNAQTLRSRSSRTLLWRQSISLQKAVKGFLQLLKWRSRRLWGEGAGFDYAHNGRDQREKELTIVNLKAIRA